MERVQARCAAATKVWGRTLLQAKKVAEFIDGGSMLERAGAEEHLLDLLRSLHSGSWFAVQGCEDVLRVEKGGRQGCKFGGVIFELCFAVAQDELRKCEGERHPVRLGGAEHREQERFG